MKCCKFLIPLCICLSVAGISLAQIPTFEDVALSAGVAEDDLGLGAAMIDVNNDGFDDIHLINDSQPGNRDFLYLNQGDLTFLDITYSAHAWMPPFSNTVRIFDVDNDGWQDMFVSTYSSSEGHRIYRNNGDNTFTDWFPQSGLRNHALSTVDLVDIDNDGWVDVYYATHDWFPFGVLWRATGPGTYTFSRQTPEQLWYICEAVFCDFDNDGDMDLFEGNLYAYNLLYENNFPNFTQIGSSAGISGSHNDFKYPIVGDYNNDGLFDIYCIYYTEWGNSPDCLYRQDTPMQFIDTLPATGITVMEETYCGCWADLDNDGWLDLLTFDATLSNAHFWHNQGDGTFVDVTQQAGLTQSTTQAFAPVTGDVNADGFLDFYLVRYGPANCLYVNSGNDNHWLQVALEGTQSNRLGIGARVKAVSGDLVQWRDPGGGRFAGSSNAPYVHLGLGDHSVVDSLYVNWPSGQVDLLLDVPADQRITVVEGSFDVSSKELEATDFDHDLQVAVNPNPFNPTTVLKYKLQDASFVNFRVYDISGHLVAELVNGWRDAGVHEVVFDPTGAGALHLASGIYLYRLEADVFSACGKMVLVK
ncbi:hypothetical protein CEE37_00435 [candidate division LCP-89 bacterium B3_LCP]|uniref:ASPIC/UnbV domain-containing protein n=1 Tax=candidate division LCP-89 bacterium B3_LCP TaxID=2012998 RepID=A0A532V4U0_UNCL8|nr:MAG: hypothetical protein CEE37_00435 [candidate division LCP-89 bacterium B3_LCP]